MEVNAYGFISAVKFALAAAGKRDVRYYVNTICLDGSNIWGTDGHRFAKVETEWRFPEQILLKRFAVEDMLKVIKPKTGSLDILNLEILPNAVVFSFEAINIWVERETDGAYPNIQRVVPAWLGKPEAGAAAGRHGLFCDYIAEAGRACKFLAERKYRRVTIHTDAATEVIIFEPHIDSHEFPDISRAIHAVAPMRL